MKSFKSLGVCDELIQALQKQGIKEPTPIQEQAIPVVFKGNDVIAKAQTGTGKTLAFLLPILQRVHTDVHQEQVLIIAPTRELVKQISDEAKEIGTILNVDILPLIGGKTIEAQLQQLGRRPQVILGTPGRLLDHAKRGSLHLDCIRRVYSMKPIKCFTWGSYRILKISSAKQMLIDNFYYSLQQFQIRLETLQKLICQNQPL